MPAVPPEGEHAASIPGRMIQSAHKAGAPLPLANHEKDIAKPSAMNRDSHIPANAVHANLLRTSFPVLFFSALLGAASLPAGAQEETIPSEDETFRAETVAEGLKNPWGMVKFPDGRFLVTERAGTLRIIQDGKVSAPVEGGPQVWAQGQGGLLDIRLHPEYETNGWIYLAYSKPFPKGALTAICRVRLKGNRLTDMETVFDPPAEEASQAIKHFGCRMDFDDEGHLFFSIGDRGDVTTPANQAQRTDNVKGKVHRIFDDGRIPPDNPFVKNAGSSPTIWSYGHRNPQGLRFQPGTGLLWQTEHGPRGGDELNIIREGRNYGWPVVTFGINYSRTPISKETSAPGLEPPVIHWTPSIAVCGMEFYTGDAFPNWKGDLFVTALMHQKLVRIRLDGEKVAHQEILLEKTGRIRDVRCFDDGYLYVIYDQPGKIIRLVPAKPEASAGPGRTTLSAPGAI